jgi:hypothetical protein
MERNPEIRASDHDRDRTAQALREHFAQGRLDDEEFNERLSDAYAAKTLGELQRLTADLPEEDLYSLPVPSQQRTGSTRGLGLTRDQIAHWSVWATVSGINFVIWLIIWITTGFENVYPWWVWVAGPWGVILLIGTIADRLKER